MKNRICPQCLMTQIASFNVYRSNCSNCGYSFDIDMRKAQGSLKDDVHIAGLVNIIAKKDQRIAELEAEVELLKKPSIAEILKANGKNPDLYGNSGLNDQRFESDLPVWKGDDLEELTEEVIRNRSMVALGPQDEMTYPEALKALQEMADFIKQEEVKQQSATDFEEGEG